MATIINDLVDRYLRLMLGYGRHPVKGTITKHVVEANQVKIQVALGWASWWDRVAGKFRGRGWHSCEGLFYQGFEIPPDNYHFHPGGPADAPDAYFPDDIAHPEASYYSALLPPGMSVDNQPDQMVGIFKTGQVADYDEDGHQLDEGGDLVVTADPDDALFYSPNPALMIADAKRRTRRSLISINWPAWCIYRDYAKALIPWDDGALTPHHVTVQAAAGGALAAATYWLRIATLKGADISSASNDRASDGVATTSVVVGAGGKILSEWTSQETRGGEGYRVYVGTAEGAEDRYFTVVGGATNTLEITTLAGATMGAPPEVATGTLIRQISRFESHIFARPVFGFATAIDRIAQITCMDWHYDQALLKFFTPEVKEPVFTVNMAECKGFKTRKTDRRQQSFNQIVGIFRDLDDPDIVQADPPVEVNRFEIQDSEGVRPFSIDFGGSYRSQVERVCNYWGRRLIDSSQMVEFDEGSPKMYGVLTAEPVKVTHNVPDWTDVQFYIESKEEPEDTKAGYPMTGRIYGEWYSDTNHNPLPRQLPEAKLNPFAAPPVVVSCTLTEEAVELTSGAPFTVIRGAVVFDDFVGQQRGRVWVSFDGGDYRATDKTIYPDPSTNEAAFEIEAVAIGPYDIKVVTESLLGVSLPLDDHEAFPIDVTGDLIRAAAPTDGVVQLDGFGDFLSTAIGHPRASEKPETYEVQVWDNEAFGVDPGTHLKGVLPVTPGTNHASLLNVGYSESGGIGNPPDEAGGGVGAGAYSVFTTTHIYRNNVYSFPWDGGEGDFGTPATGVTLEALTKTYQWFDFGLQYFGANLSGAGFAAAVGLQTRADADPVSGSFAPDSSVCPLYMETSVGTFPGTVKLTFKSFGVTVFEVDDVDPGFSNGFTTGSDPSTSPRSRPGPRVRFQIAGSEYRVTLNPQLGGRPLFVLSTGSAGPDFPLRLAATCTGVYKTYASAVVNIQSGGDFLTTTYSVANQIKFQGSQQTRVFLRWVQKSKYSQIPDGLPLDLIAPPL